jgi:hypothetical protein
MGKIATRKYCNEKNGSNVYIYGSTTKCPTAANIKGTKSNLEVSLKYDDYPNKLVQETDIVNDGVSNNFLIIHGKYKAITSAITCEINSVVSTLGTSTVVAGIVCEIKTVFMDGTYTKTVTTSVSHNHLKSDNYICNRKYVIEIPKKTTGFGYCTLKSIELQRSTQTYMAHHCEIVKEVLPLSSGFDYLYTDIKYKITGFTSNSGYSLTFKPTLTLTMKNSQNNYYKYSIQPVFEKSDITSRSNPSVTKTTTSFIYTDTTNAYYYGKGYYPKILKILYRLFDEETQEIIDEFYILAPVSNNSGMELSSLIDDDISVV